MLFDYARVCTADQNPGHQIDALTRAGVAANDIYVDDASGTKASRLQLDIVLRTLRDGGTLKITRLDCLGRSVLHLVTLGASCASAASACTSSSRASTPRRPKAARCSGCCSSASDFGPAALRLMSAPFDAVAALSRCL